MDNFEFLKKLKPVDLIVIIGIAIALAVGFVTFKAIITSYPTFLKLEEPRFDICLLVPSN